MARSVASYADEILKIPVCTRNTKDFLAWHPNKKGHFIVSSAHKFMVRTKIQQESWLDGRSGSSDNSQEKDWPSLWNVAVPSKVRVFLWRLARYSIPTTDVLHRRNMAQVNSCRLCGSEDTWRHALLSSTMGRCTWAL